jgi:ABC-type phosphate transport system permease subunit
MTFQLYFQLMLTGVLLFLLSFFGAQVEAPRKHKTWYEALVGSIFLISLVLFFGGAAGSIWTFRP